LNYEINLHCDDKARKGRLSRFPFSTAAIIILGLFTIAAIYLSTFVYLSHLKTLIAGYEAEVSRLEAETVPLEALEEKILVLGLKAKLLAGLQPAGQPVSVILQLVTRQASENLVILSVTLERGGSVQVSGISTRMQSVAAYSQALENLSCIERAEITQIKLAGSGIYDFNIELQPGEESSNETGE
jgi:Tfp pilus assembly protein PilN